MIHVKDETVVKIRTHADQRIFADVNKRHQNLVHVSELLLMNATRVCAALRKSTCRDSAVLASIGLTDQECGVIVSILVESLSLFLTKW